MFGFVVDGGVERNEKIDIVCFVRLRMEYDGPDPSYFIVCTSFYSR